MTETILIAISLICFVASLIPFVPCPSGSVRAFDFGRLQVLALSLAALLASLVGEIWLWDGWTAAGVASIAMAAAAAAIQFSHILPFTPIWPVETARFEGDETTVPTLSLLACNVKQGNRDYQRVIDLINQTNPDIAVFMETDRRWVDALRPALSDYLHIIEQPQENSYGMIFATRFAMRDAKVQFLLNEEVPSITGVVQLSPGRDVRIVVIHPEPPIPTRDTLGRDAEILVAARIAREETLPILITGDLNDVAWSKTTRRFQRLSGLLDPRQGRGFFNSFHAEYPVVRWPLDHLFHSGDFQLLDIDRKPFVGSDHFPMYYRFALAGNGASETPPPPSRDDVEDADEAISIEKNRDRRPAGTDWED
ncbi:MAG: endonuclease/exonuclease/phosphatase family protein [Hoeflea sp.]|uniref:endonuclease/exonuclease/phosphatase family protein n=1 Tax=Hoeflea sp. TaxID=1940281 RepID=UPI0032EAE45E